MTPILDQSPDGTVTRYHEDGERVILEHTHPDVSAVERLNAEQRNTRSTFERKGDMHHVMRVPASILTKICAETGLDFFNNDDSRAIMEILKRPEYAAFRTYSGKI